MPKIIQYAVLDGVEQIVVITKDGGIAATHYNGEFIVVDFYTNKISNNIKIEDDELWADVNSGRRYWKDWKEKQDIDEEIIISMARWLYEQSDLIVLDSDKVLYAQDKKLNCFCKDDLEAFLGKNYFANGNN